MAKDKPLDTEKIAQSLGAVHIATSKKLVTSPPLEQIIPELTKEDLHDKQKLGTAYGTDLHHCIYLASKYCTNFSERVTGYYPTEDRKENFSGIGIDFYEKKSS